MTPLVLERLITHGRARDAIQLAGHATNRINDELLLRILEEGVQSSSEDAQAPAMFQYYVERIFQQLDKSEALDPDRLAKLEWVYLNVLEDSSRPPIMLHRQLATSPKFFVEVLSAVYRSSSDEENTEEEPDREREQKAAIASHAWTLLHSWHQVPGEKNGGVDGAVLEAWVNDARQLCEEAGRTDIGDEKIGEMLAWAPADEDGIWPCEAVREVIEVVRSRHLETGVYIGVKNKRGVTSRGVFDGGEQERDLVVQYRGYADAVRLEWPRMAAVLDRIADSYDVEAQEHDDDAERRQG